MTKFNSIQQICAELLLGPKQDSASMELLCYGSKWARNKDRKKRKIILDHDKEINK